MNRWKQFIPYIAGVAITVAAFSIFKSPTASAAIRATFVEIVIPSNPFYDTMSVTNTKQSIGPDTGTLGVTNITLTNYDSSPQQVFIFAPVFGSGLGCGTSGSSIIGGGGPQLQVYVQPTSTLTISYPTPLTYNNVSGHTCIAAQVTTTLHGGSVGISVNGFVN